MKTKWKWVVGYKGIYKVSNKGKVKSVPRYVCYVHFGFLKAFFHQGRVLKDAPNKEGYRQVGLCKNGKLKSFLIHKLVLDTFIGLKPNGKECRHKDSNPANNFLTNIEWAGKGRNMQDKVDRGTAIFGGKKNKYREARNKLQTRKQR